MAKLPEDRVDHALHTVERTTTPHHLIFLGVRTRQRLVNRKMRLYEESLDFGYAKCCRLISGEYTRWQSIEFGEHEGFWQWVSAQMHKGRSIWIIGHGIMKQMHLLRMWDKIEDGTFTLERQGRGKEVKKDSVVGIHDRVNSVIVDTDPPTIIILHRERSSLHIVDTRNYSEATPRQMAERQEVLLHEPADGEPTTAELMLMLRQEVTAVKDWFTALLKDWHENSLGKFGHTAASCSMSSYRAQGMPKSLWCHSYQPAIDLERQAIAGGYFRCFRVGHFADEGFCYPRVNDHECPWDALTMQGGIHKLDVNSLYPHVMANCKMPIRLCAYKEHADVYDLMEWRKELLVIAHVKVSSMQREFPTWVDGERYYCVGNYWATLCGPELDYAIDNELIQDVGAVSCYFPGCIFDRWVKHLHGLRVNAMLRGDKIYSDWYKTLLNSLWGKISQKSGKWESIIYEGERPAYGTWVVCDYDSADNRIYRAMSGSVQIQGVERETVDSIPAIGAFINSYARDHMWKLRQLIPRGSLWYQGCDGLHVDYRGFDALRGEIAEYTGQLGKLKHEGYYKWGQYRGPMDYSLGEEHTVAGLDIEDGADIGSEQFRNVPLTVKRVLASRPDGKVVMQKVRVIWGHYHPCGRVQIDGTVLPPLLLDGRLTCDGGHGAA